jgi:DNA-binding NarL/FixJ family response regulator
MRRYRLESARQEGAEHASDRHQRRTAGSIDLAADLSPRQMDVLRQLASGDSNREIAVRLSVSPETIKSHVASLLSKLQLPNRTALVAYAVRLGLIE